jgi:hypothetical protein
MRAGSLAVAIICGLTSSAFAGPDVYCDAYARDAANRKTGNDAAIPAGAGGSTIGGSVAGGVVGKDPGASKGAVVGGITGTVLVAPAADEKWQKSYQIAFEACMVNYAPEEAPQKTEAAAAAVPLQKPAKRKSGKDWAEYCAAHYRSYNPQTGKYKSYSGEWRACR